MKMKKREWNLNSRVNVCWFKFYAEQVGCPQGADFDTQLKYLRDYFYGLTKQTFDYWWDSIIHYRDTNIDDLWGKSSEKPHAHLLTVSCRRQSSNNKLIPHRISTLINSLGLNYRPEDDIMMSRGGIIPLSYQKNEHIRSMVYHTHETVEAQETIGKELYDRSERYTNIPSDVLDEWYEYYFKFMNMSKRHDVELPTKAKISDYMDYAFDLGFHCDDLDDFLNSIPRHHLLANGVINSIRFMYEQGVTQFLKSPAAKHLIRCCIYIQGEANTGKTHTTNLTFEELKIPCVNIDGSDSGRFDNVTPSVKALLFNDTSVPNILNLADNKAVALYRRNRNNPIFCGNYIVITSNLSFNDFLAKYAYQFAQRKAISSRFYVVELDPYTSTLNVIDRSTRGLPDEISERDKLFDTFKETFERLHLPYQQTPPPVVAPPNPFIYTPSEPLMSKYTPENTYDPSKPITAGIHDPETW